MCTLEPAVQDNAAACYQIIEAAKSFQQEQGFVQWTEDYPSLATVEEDIRAAKGYVVRVNGEIAGYMCVDFDGEPAYDHIDGSWSADAPYAVVHRMAFAAAFRGMGLADTTFGLIEALCVDRGVPYIRVDTDFPNKRMQHILTKNGFKPCGTVTFQGGAKLAYDKQLPSVPRAGEKCQKKS